jgi:TolB-like protein
VTREQLISKLWPKGIVDFDTGLNTAIRKLRVALGDTADKPRYIETLPRRGYRFIAALELDPAREPEPQAQPQPESAACVRPIDDQPVRTTEDSLRQTTVPPRTGHRRYFAFLTALTVALVGVVVVRDWISREPARESAVTVAPSFSPPPHSVAVLPFVNISGDKDQEYFSDGLSEELLNALSRIDGLQVVARTSSFSFRGEHTDIAVIARKLNVATVLEGSVRRSGHTVRVSAELVDAITGYQLWSQSYDRSLGDVLALQTEIAAAVTHALQVTMLGGVAATTELGATRNPAAFDAYLRGLKWARTPPANAANALASIAAYSDAIRLDPGYALALAGRAYTLGTYAGNFASVPAVRESWDRARADAEKAIALAPNLGEAHMALGAVHLYASLDFIHAGEELDRALALAPGNAIVLYEYARFAAYLGRADAAIAAARRGAGSPEPSNPSRVGRYAPRCETLQRGARGLSGIPCARP